MGTAQLTGKDLETVLDLAYEAQGCQRLDSFCQDFMPQLGRLVPYDSIGYNEVDLSNGTACGDTDPPEIRFDGLEETLMSFIHQHPLAAIQAQGDMSARRISDHLSVRQFHRLGLYQDVYRRLGTEDQIAFGLPGSVIVAIAVNRTKRSFTQRDLDVLDMLRPNLARSYASLIERERNAALMWAFESGLEHHDAAVIQVDRLGRIVHSSPVATELLSAYCGRSSRTRLPVEITAWLRTRGRSLIIEGPRGRLRVQVLDSLATDWQPLLLEEQRPAVPSIEWLQELGLTTRQAQVMRLIARGKKNDEIAHELMISKETVRKHVEHIYEQLGVHSRAQAVARVLG